MNIKQCPICKAYYIDDLSAYDDKSFTALECSVCKTKHRISWGYNVIPAIMLTRTHLTDPKRIGMKEHHFPDISGNEYFRENIYLKIGEPKYIARNASYNFYNDDPFGIQWIVVLNNEIERCSSYEDALAIYRVAQHYGKAKIEVANITLYKMNGEISKIVIPDNTITIGCKVVFYHCKKLQVANVICIEGNKLIVDHSVVRISQNSVLTVLPHNTYHGRVFDKIKYNIMNKLRLY